MTTTKLMTIQEVCKELNLSRSRINEWIQSGELKSYKLGFSRRISEEQLNAFLEQRSSNGFVQQ